jgi:aldehyde:ferredoxin oxidoreductase
VQDESVLFNIKGRGPEYETLAALGSLCLNDNLEAIVRANDLCNRYGLDTIEAGATIAWAMECFEKKILSERDVGMKLKWGDGEAIIKLVDLMAKREGFGDILAEGVRGASQKVGGKSLSFAMHVKGSSICMHDPRVNPEMGLKYATLSMGAYHGKGCPYLEPKKDVAANVVDGQNFAEIVDSLVMCEFAFAAWAGGLPRGYVPRLFSAVTGRRAYWKLLNEIGQRIYNMKRSYITELGISKKDDNLPKRFTEILRIRGGISHSANIEPILPEYYKIRGWDERGVPTKERLKELKITPLK